MAKPPPIDSIHYPVGIDAGSGRMLLERDYGEHVKQQIRQILLTGRGERINMPDFGAGLRQVVFQPNSDATAQLTQSIIFENLNRWLGDRIEVEEIVVKAENELLNVRVAYVLKARQERQFLNLEVTL